MKKTAVIFIVAALVVAGTLIWIVSSPPAVTAEKIVMPVVLALVVGFAVFIGIRRLRSMKKGQPAEDELSKNVLQKSAATAFYISLYLWLAVMYASGKMDYEIHEFLGAGIVGMAVIYALCWLYYNFRGVGNE